MSGIALGLHPQIADADQALSFQPVIRHSHLRRLAPRQVPFERKSHSLDAFFALTSCR